MKRNVTNFFQQQDQQVKEQNNFQNLDGLFKVVKTNKYGALAKLIKLVNTDEVFETDQLFYSVNKVPFEKKDYFIGVLIKKANDPTLYYESKTENLVLKNCKNCDKCYCDINLSFPYYFKCPLCNFHMENPHSTEKPYYYNNSSYFF